MLASLCRPSLHAPAFSDSTPLLNSSMVVEGRRLLRSSSCGSRRGRRAISCWNALRLVRTRSSAWVSWRSRSGGARWSCTGLGSCIGLALLGRRSASRVCPRGVARIGRPREVGTAATRFADHAVPELIDKVVALGGRRSMLEAVLVGGASMLHRDRRLDEVLATQTTRRSRPICQGPASRSSPRPPAATAGRIVRIDRQSSGTGLVASRRQGTPNCIANFESSRGLKWPEFSSLTTPLSCARWCPTLVKAGHR